MGSPPTTNNSKSPWPNLSESSPGWAVGLLLVPALSTVALIAAAPHLIDAPWFVLGWLFGAALIHLVGLRFIPRLSGIFEKGPGHNFSRFSRLLLLTFCLFQVIFSFTGFYFSDDSLRHIYDGYGLLHNWPIYEVPPVVLGNPLELPLNHPDRATIYLPLTQLQALIGAWLHPRFGFPFLFHLSIALLALCITALLSKKEKLRFLLLILSPGMLVINASRHADFQGAGLLCLVLLFIGKQGAGSGKWERRWPRKEGRGSWINTGLAFLAGLFAGCLPGLKGEGFLWVIFLSLAVVLRRRNLVSHLIFFAGLAVSAALLGLFSVLILFPTEQAFLSFLNTVNFFLLWFTAYNPFLDPGLVRTANFPELVGEFRKSVLLLFLITLSGILAVFLRRVCLRRHSAAINKQDLNNLFLRISCLALLLALFSKGAWNPWYFLWLLPCLYLLDFWRGILFFVTILPAFYVPVAFYRASGVWAMDGFYFALITCLTPWLFLTGKAIANRVFR